MKFLMKWVLNGIIVTLLLYYYSNVGLWTALVAATGLTVISWFVGDQLILRNTNNTLASLMDGVLTAVYLGLLSYLFDWRLTVGAIALISILIAVAEWVFHRFVLRGTPLMKSAT
ncbi:MULTISPECIES: DUF2512 family protein [Cohnella]|uniref:DUF2512 family protein n=1 Tax=Cohnella TaxID=329857 RepID=UPI0015931FF2|nr:MULTISPECIES: DUF2512 family protein [Cohnella]MBN2983660.1 DUF2512 family protein [Cohnella algarum]